MGGDLFSLTSRNVELNRPLILYFPNSVWAFKMNDNFNKLKGERPSTNYPRWRNVTSTFFLGLICLGIVGSFLVSILEN
jgi:hypothetical protein